MNDLRGPSSLASFGGALESTYANDPSMLELIQFFVTDLQAAVTALAPCVEGQDRESLRRFAHQLKGAAGGYGFPAITARAGELEVMLLGGAPWPEIIDAHDALKALCHRAVAPPVVRSS